MSQNLHKYLRTETLPTPFCPGCGHGILMGAVLRAIDEGGFDFSQMVFVSGIGCAGWIPSPHFATDTLHTLHGRPVAYATGVKLFNPKLKVVVISGDGDLAAIGGNHLIHAARRNIPILVICANNSIYGMTGGQVSPTTPIGIKTETTKKGSLEPCFDLCRLVEAAGATYVARYTVFHPRPLIRAIKKGLAHNGFGFIDVISPCPTHYGRKNRMATLYEMFLDLKKYIVTQERFKELKPEERKDKILIGEFND